VDGYTLLLKINKNAKMNLYQIMPTETREPIRVKLRRKEILALTKGEDPHFPEEKFSNDEIASMYNIPLRVVQAIVSGKKLEDITLKIGLDEEDNEPDQIEKLELNQVAAIEKQSEDIIDDNRADNRSNQFQVENAQASLGKNLHINVSVDSPETKFEDLSALHILNHPELVNTNEDLFHAIKRITDYFVSQGKFKKSDDDGSIGNYGLILNKYYQTNTLWVFKFFDFKNKPSVFANQYEISTDRFGYVDNRTSAENAMHLSYGVNPSPNRDRRPKEITLMFEGDSFSYGEDKTPQSVFKSFADKFLDFAKLLERYEFDVNTSNNQTALK
jgi:hypothetical protein